MPNNRNAAKAMRQANRRRLRNRAARTSLRTVIRNVKEASRTGDGAAAAPQVRFGGSLAPPEDRFDETSPEAVRRMRELLG